MLLNCADLSEKKGMKLDNLVRGSPGLCGGGLWWWCLRIESDTRVFSLRFFILFFTPGTFARIYTSGTQKNFGGVQYQFGAGSCACVTYEWRLRWEFGFVVVRVEVLS